VRTRRPVPLAVCVLVMGSGVVRAQQHDEPVTLRGTVIDTAHHPTRGVLVYLSLERVFTVSDVRGTFELAGVGREEDTLQFRGLGFAPLAFLLHVPPSAHGTVNVGTVLLPPGPPPTMDLTATVRDTVQHQPVVGAQVVVNDRPVGLTDSAGGLRARGVPVDWGLNMMLVRRIGYTPVVRMFRVTGQKEERSFSGVMDPNAIDLPAVVVEADRIILAWGRLRDFSRRRESGQGRFFTRDDIVLRRPHFVSDLLVTVPGLSVVRERGRASISSTRGTLGRCAPSIWVDGLRLSPEDDLDTWVRPQDVDGIEVYVGSEPPPQFGGFNACGAIVVWTR
jgi:hypothetical protein